MVTESGYKVAHLLVVGIVFHLVYIGTVFDCYFTSPVVHGMRPHTLGHGESKRLVLIVGDGLRADFLFSSNASDIVPGVPERVAPHLRGVVETRGAFGVSHTRVPTESRPGHVALIGGMYEDVSAVTKGWKTNPVDFDSVFNRSSHTFSFGSPDILPMFSRGATPGRVKTWCYDEDDEDFTKDVWVLDQLKKLFHNASVDPMLDAQLRQPQVVFFLHLLGLDTTGHAYRPHSKEYMNNIQVVDDITRQTEQLISEFYGDEDTSFVFTADHGMSRIGNHGDGDPDNTRTPLVAWGAGVRGPVQRSPSTELDDYAAPWKLDHLVRRDVEQADIAALMSTLLGIPWPVNSVGVLPDVDPTEVGYLKMKGGERDIAKAALVNAKVVLEHYRVKHELKMAHTLFYKPFRKLDHPTPPNGYPGETRIAEIEALVLSGGYRASRHLSSDLIRDILEGLRYLETYDRTLIRVIVTAAYSGWIAYSASFLLLPYGVSNSRLSSVISALSLSALVAFWTLFAIQRSPGTFYVYIIFPLYFWRDVLTKMSSVVGRPETTDRLSRSAYSMPRYAVHVGLTAVVLQCMVLGYTHRAIWSVGCILIGVVWPLISWPSTIWSFLPPWALACFGTAIFPLLRVDPTESLLMILIGGAAMLLVGTVSWISLRKFNGYDQVFKRIITVQLLLILASIAVTAGSVRSLQSKSGLPLVNQILGWVIFLTSFAFPFFRTMPTSAEARLLVYFLTFCPCFVILSIRAEGLFYLSYSATLFLWSRVEEAVRQRIASRDGVQSTRQARDTWNPSGLRRDDVRIALFFLFFVQIGFFGTGNVASISSFYLEPVYRLVPIFNPFLMASLLIFKILAPYAILSASFATLNARLGMPPFALFLVALTLTDGMTMTFFFNVTDTGSWLQIGQSISHFCITSLLLVFSAGIAAAGELLMGGTALPRMRPTATKED
ncbi:PigN-domain-containing protein [Artomyces pyxidatus]|uniref:PigN-domain-containing protein n=1 Tax=Artomyces pyxidatus TaxID=48021 RepID=A0ACB8SXS1_9AGAM|nr:PigN-domain-containing protein [Artomyces pyxidatus]